MYSHAQGTSECLEHTFNEMVVVVAGGLDMKITFHGTAERLKEMTEHLGGSVSQILAGEGCAPLKFNTAPKIYENHGTALVHGKHETVTLNASFVAKGLEESIAQCYRHIFHCMVFVNLQITFTYYYK